MESLAHGGVLELLQKRPGEIHMQAGHVLVSLYHSGRAIIAPQDLLCLPRLAGVMHLDKVPERLMHVKSQGMVYLTHGLAPCYMQTPANEKIV